jgi:hypothetical protein
LQQTRRKSATAAKAKPAPAWRAPWPACTEADAAYNKDLAWRVITNRGGILADIFAAAMEAPHRAVASFEVMDES